MDDRRALSTVSVVIYVTLTVTLVTEARLHAIQLPKEVQDCFNQVDASDTGDFVHSTLSWTCGSFLGRNAGNETTKIFDKTQARYFEHLMKQIANNSHQHGGNSRSRRSHGAAPPCVRREYRLLSDSEREKFHLAIRALKQDTSVRPNKYDSLAILHTGLGVKKAHQGAGFPGWHRVYTFMFEQALREVDPSVCLPYWDSTLDAGMDDPSASQVWSNEFFGTAHGPVTEGPFAGFKSAKGTPLTRDVGDDGELFSHSTLDDILSRDRYEEILSHMGSRTRYRLEHHHNAVHVFIGGTMDKLDGSAFDPIFWLHHAYIDYVWERFRQKLKRAGRDPEKYPRVSSNSHHAADAEMGILAGLTQDTGYKNLLSRLFLYVDAPTCPDCGSRYLKCHRGKCIPLTIAEMHHLPGYHRRPRRSTDDAEAPMPACSASRHGDISVIQNDFCVDDVCDVREWVAVPVQVVSVRPPRATRYHSYPVHHGRINTSSDIYSTENVATSKMREKQKTFKRCSTGHAVGKVFLTSRGINYDGNYKETVIVDNRLPLSVSMGHIFVKKPQLGSREPTVLLQAHDSCGRVCQPYCQQGEHSRRCSGAVAVDTQDPRMYRDSPEEAIDSVFESADNEDLPVFRSDRVFLSFYCDYRQKFPYMKTEGRKGENFSHGKTGGDNFVRHQRIDN